MRLKHRFYKGGWSEVIDREVSDRGSAARLVTCDPSAYAVFLLEQFRIAPQSAEKSPWSLEIFAGMIDKESESPDEVVHRELVEEAGLVPDYLEKITSYWVSPGGSSASMYIYVALCDLSGAEGIYGLDDEQEDILVVVVPRESVYQSALADETGNAAPLIGL